MQGIFGERERAHNDYIRTATYNLQLGTTKVASLSKAPKSAANAAEWIKSNSDTCAIARRTDGRNK